MDLGWIRSAAPGAQKVPAVVDIWTFWIFWGRGGQPQASPGTRVRQPDVRQPAAGGATNIFVARGQRGSAPPAPPRARGRLRASPSSTTRWPREGASRRAATTPLPPKPGRPRVPEGPVGVPPLGAARRLGARRRLQLRTKLQIHGVTPCCRAPPSSPGGCWRRAPRGSRPRKDSPARPCAYTRACRPPWRCGGRP